MTTQEIIEKIEEYKQLVKNYGYEPQLTDEEVSALTISIDNIPKKYQKDIDLIKEKDYSTFHNLPYYLRNYYGALAVNEFKAEIGREISLEDVRVQEYLKKNAMNPVFRAGISAGRDNNRTHAMLDAYMSNYLFEKTLLPPNNEERARVISELGDQKAQAAFAENLEKQRVIAKTLFMAHLGQYVVKSSNRTEIGYLGLVSETMAHGSRTNVVLPFGGDQTAVMNAFVSEQTTKDANVYGRFAATHTVDRMKVVENGIVLDTSTEKKPILIGNFLKHYGMDFATGGIGSIGPDRKTVYPNGPTGHLYIRKEKGDETHCGSLLLGFESCAPLTTSSTGHNHNLFAKSAKQTSFLANKGGVGRNLDGRMVDLSGLSSAEFITVMNAFDQKYKQLQNEATTEEGLKRLADFNKILCGNRLKTAELETFVENLGLQASNAKDLVNKARMGAEMFELKFDPTNITREKAEDYFRKKIPQEEACRIAQTRFSSALDCLTAVNAIKELQKIHNARSWGWTLLNPLKNYRENKTIDNMIKDLYNLEKAKLYTSQEVQEAFNSKVDTYTYNYGPGLNNLDGIRLIQRHSENFLKSDKDTEKLDKQFAKLGEYAKKIVFNARMDESIRKSRFPQATVVEPNEAARAVQAEMDEDTVSVDERAQEDYNKMIEEAKKLGVINEEKPANSLDNSSVSENLQYNPNIIGDDYRDNMIIEEVIENEDNLQKSEFISEDDNQLIRDVSKN